ncbi:hypothetical protein [Pedobacter sp. SL55]|uniref:hypothetical protein n=1 Tax=Pedobacter sp. SL55 TaxID=2995161 RepID=UPI002270C6A6|nr:hypothetical protein [Pedobacter sp. SL55]WAC42594.1 hypothetical protein OVA16_09630 [Pedobacter sp. SL55]
MTTKFYKAEGTTYVLKTSKMASIIGLIVFIALEIYFLFFAPQTKDSTLYKIVPLFPLILCLIELGKCAAIDVAQKTITTSIYGSLNKKQFQFSEIKRFITTQHRTNFIKSGVSLSIEFVKDGKLETLEFAKLNKAASLEQLLAETKEIMKL